jgi:hypothetical protein
MVRPLAVASAVVAAVILAALVAVTFQGLRDGFL